MALTEPSGPPATAGLLVLIPRRTRPARSRRVRLRRARFHAARASRNPASILEFVAARRIAGYCRCRRVPLSPWCRRRARSRTFVLLSVVGPRARGRWRSPHGGRRSVAQPFGSGTSAANVEAASLDVVLLPLVGFDRQGHRLGTGGGFYDRTFAFRQQSPAPPLLIGIAYTCQEVDSLEPAEWDVDLDWVVTEREAIDCVKRRG